MITIIIFIDYVCDHTCTINDSKAYSLARFGTFNSFHPGQKSSIRALPSASVFIFAYTYQTKDSFFFSNETLAHRHKTE